MPELSKKQQTLLNALREIGSEERLDIQEAYRKVADALGDLSEALEWAGDVAGEFHGVFFQERVSVLKIREALSETNLAKVLFFDMTNGV
jgi:hypothetical protein